MRKKVKTGQVKSISFNFHFLHLSPLTSDLHDSSSDLINQTHLLFIELREAGTKGDEKRFHFIQNFSSLLRHYKEFHKHI